MNNAFQTEILKLKKNKMALIGFVVTISIPILLILKSILIDKTKIDYHEWIMTVSMLVNLVLPIMSGFFITQSMQKEYGEKTIINIVTAPVNRKTFVFSKIAVWFCWYLVLSRYDCYRMFNNRWFIDFVPFTSHIYDYLFYNTVIYTNWSFKLYCIFTDYLDCYKAENIILSNYAMHVSFCATAICGYTSIRRITSSSKFCTVVSNTNIYYATAK
ncbi:hypothetical protein C4Z44_17370 [Clostridioides difficile]